MRSTFPIKSKLVSAATAFSIAVTPMISGCGGADEPVRVAEAKPMLIVPSDSSKSTEAVPAQPDLINGGKATAAEACVRGGKVAGGALALGTVALVALDCVFLACAGTMAIATTAVVSAPKVVAGGCAVGIVENEIPPLKGRETQVVIREVAPAAQSPSEAASAPSGAPRPSISAASAPEPV